MARRYAAILAADLTGFRPQPANDDKAPGSKGHPPGILPMIAGFEGRLVDRPGSGILVEFLDVVDAAKCAASLQDVMQERNACMIPERRAQLRIGIDHGEVTAEGSRLSGENVDVATRLEAICQPGGICISDRVYDRIKGRFHGPYEDIGEQALKDVSAPVRAYRIGSSASPPGRRPRVAIDPVRARRPRAKAMAAASIAAILLISAGIGGTWLAQLDGPAGDTRVAAAKPPADAPAKVAQAAPEPNAGRKDRPAHGDFQVAALPAGDAAAPPRVPSAVTAADPMPSPDGGSRVEIHVAEPSKPADQSADIRVAGPSLPATPRPAAQVAAPIPVPAAEPAPQRAAAEPVAPQVSAPDPVAPAPPEPVRKPPQAGEPPQAVEPAQPPAPAKAAEPAAPAAQPQKSAALTVPPAAAPEPAAKSIVAAPPKPAPAPVAAPSAAPPAPAPAAKAVEPAKPAAAEPEPVKPVETPAPPVAGTPATSAPEKPAAPQPKEMASLPPDNRAPLSEKAREEFIVELTKKGIQAALSKDYSFARLWFDEIILMQPDNLQALNNRCWVNALMDDIPAALKDCDAALKLRPTFLDALDSRGFVKLKIGRVREAIADYDAALKIQGDKASSLYGRGIAKKRAGNAAGGNADIKRALTMNPRIAEEFAGYGIR
jgi:hypothetical protein